MESKNFSKIMKIKIIKIILNFKIIIFLNINIINMKININIIIDNEE